jgi:hypothetical protein
MTARDRVAALFARWQDRDDSYDKFDFYVDTLPLRPALIVEVTGIDRRVVLDRRRYMRELAPQS